MSGFSKPGRLAAAVLACVVAGGAARATRAATISYGFDDGTAQGWSNTKSSPGSVNAPTDFHPYQQVAEANAPPSESGAYSIEPNVASFSCANGCFQDNPHGTLVFTSPAFTLGSNGAINFSLVGGTGGIPGGNFPAAVPNFSSLPASSSPDSGFEGLALRRADTGAYLLAATKSGVGATYQSLSFSNAQLQSAGALNNNVPLVLDLIDYNSGSWGWVGLDSVTLNDASPVPEPAALGLVGVGGLLLARRRRA